MIIKKNFTDDKTVLEKLIEDKVEIDHICEGNASCGTCRILIKGECSDLPPRGREERKLSSSRKFQENERLACQLRINKKLEFEV